MAGSRPRCDLEARSSQEVPACRRTSDVLAESELPARVPREARFSHNDSDNEQRSRAALGLQALVHCGGQQRQSYGCLGRLGDGGDVRARWLEHPGRRGWMDRRSARCALLPGCYRSSDSMRICLFCTKRAWLAKWWGHSSTWYGHRKHESPGGRKPIKKVGR